MTYLPDSIMDILGAPEGAHYEFKEWKRHGDFTQALKYCCALSNCGGGLFVLGVTDKRPRKIVGSMAFEQPERTCRNLMDKLHVKVDFRLYKHEDMPVIVFEVAGRPAGLPIQVDGIAWWRVGDSLVPMPEDVRRTIYSESGRDFSSDICHGAKIGDLDSDAIETFRKTWHEFSDNNRIANLTVEQLLRDSGAITDDGVTYAALVLFGKPAALRKYLPQAEIVFEYRSVEAAGPAAQRVDFRVGFFNSYDRIWELVNLRNDKQHYQKGFHVNPVSTFNERVVREAVLNAASHRDYQLGGSIFVRQYRNRIVIESPGGFPTGITVENILNRQSPRNNLIADIFQLCGLVERAGQGMNMMYEMAIKEAKPLPDFRGSDMYCIMLTLVGKVYDPRMLALVKIIDDERLEAMSTDDYLLLATLFRGKNLDDIKPSQLEHLAELGIVKQTERGFELASGDLTLLTDGKDVSPIDYQQTANRLPIDCQLNEERLGSDWGTIGAVDRKRQIINFFVKNKKSTSSQLAEYTGLTQGRVRKILKELVADGVIEKIGDYRYAAYIVKNDD